VLTDSYGRPVESIRISVTQRCNLRCFYCHREGDFSEGRAEMSPREIERIVSLAASFGVSRVKLTGGEPLLRTDIVSIVQKIKDTPGIKKVSMTTNGILLAKYAEPLKEAGLARVNVTLDTLKPKRFKQITGLDVLENVVSGIKEAARVGLYPVKVNMVLLKGVNEDELMDLVNFAGENRLILQIIELETAVEDETYKRYHADLGKVEDYLKDAAEKIVIRRMHHRRQYYLRNGTEVEIVKPMHNTEFCRYCNRLRITADGKLKPCLFISDNLVDFLTPMRKRSSEESLKELFIEAVKRRKPYFT